MARPETATAPPKSEAGARRRMIRSATVLFRERGIEGTALSDVIEHSGAPRGSIYHHFPDGKAQLAEEATRYAGDYLAAGLAAALEHDDPVAAIGYFVKGWGEQARRSDFAAGCPVVAAALEGDRSPGARDSAAAAFGSWEQMLADALERRGVAPERARLLGTLAIAAVEGAIVLARAERSTAPLERVGAELERLYGEALTEASGHPANPA